MRWQHGAWLLCLAACASPAPPPPPPAAPEIDAAAFEVAIPTASVSQAPAPPPAPRLQIAGAIPCTSKAPADMRTALGAAKGAGAQLVIDVRPGDQCGLPGVTGLDAALLVLEGTVSATPTLETGSLVLEPWDAMLLPGMGVQLRGHTAPATIVVAIAARDGKTLEAALPAGTPWRDRPAPVVRASIAKADKLTWGNGAFSAQIAFGAPESRNVSLEVLTIDEAASIPEHTHTEVELITVLEGGGTMRVAGSDRQLEPGQQASIPAKTKHAFVGGSGRTVVIQSYAPAGAEQRFKKLAADDAPAATK